MYRRSFVLLFLIIGKVSSAIAQETPLWEAGLGLGAVAAPDYRGADQGRTYLLPIPYFVYYGKRVSVDRRGVRGELFGSARASFNVSASLGPPSSSTNGARTGMPDLDPTIEIGPSLDIDLDDGADRNPSLTLRLPLRTVIATDLSHWHNVGWVFLPNIALHFKNTGPGGAWDLGVSTGPIFANKAYHDYYYTVRPEFATPTRPAFDAGAGYSGASVGVTLSRRFDGYWVGGFLRYDYLRNAVFDDSPLVRTPNAFYAGVAFSRIVARSSESARSRRADP
ncbi:MAG TPA: MipA/OmpV family protein [Burkholderiales bacterium]